MAFADFVENVKTDRATQLKTLVMLVLGITGFTIGCQQVSNSRHVNVSGMFARRWNSRFESKMMEGQFLPAVTICPSHTWNDFHRRTTDAPVLQNVKCEYIRAFTNGTTPPKGTDLLVKKHDVAVESMDGEPSLMTCYSANMEMHYVAHNWTQNIQCSMQFENQQDTEFFPDGWRNQARVVFWENAAVHPYAVNTDEPADWPGEQWWKNTYGWKTLDPGRHQELYIRRKTFNGPKIAHRIWMMDVGHGEWWNYNLTAMQTDPAHPALSFQYGYEHLWSEDYDEFITNDQPYTGTMALGVAGGFGFLLALLTSTIVVAGTTIFKLDTTAIDGGSVGGSAPGMDFGAKIGGGGSGGAYGTV